MPIISFHRASQTALGYRLVALAFTFASILLINPFARGQNFNLLYTANTSNGELLLSALVKGPGGAIYGTTATGGTGTDCFGGSKYGCGTVFELTQDGKYKVLYSFLGGRNADGAAPTKGVIRDSAGNLYGTTETGGSSLDFGTVFKLDSSGNETVLHSFTGYADGSRPFAGVVLDGAGNLYGTTQAGGAFADGTVFKVDPSGTETVLYSFSGAQDGALPSANVLLDASGNIYGTAYLGGDPVCSFGNGCGVIFKLDASGYYSVLHTFTGTEGKFPSTDLARDGHGNLYGATSNGGDFDDGVAYKLDPAGNLTVLHSFTGGSDGRVPDGGLVLDSQGSLYGTTAAGGRGVDWGTVFRIDRTGTFSVVHTFINTDGASPRADLLIDKAGVLYGTTDRGGDLRGCHNIGCGVVFSITPP